MNQLGIVLTIRDLLWRDEDTGEVDLEKPWPVDTLNAVAEVLKENGFGPETIRGKCDYCKGNERASACECV